jgi:quinol monooxygenase YgiN
MSKLAIVATIKTVPGKREEYLKHLNAHAERCLATEPGTLKFEILVPQKEADTVMLYEVYASPEAFEAHWTWPSMQQAATSTASPHHAAIINLFRVINRYVGQYRALYNQTERAKGLTMSCSLPLLMRWGNGLACQARLRSRQVRRRFDGLAN